MMFPNQFCGWISNRRRFDREIYDWKKLQKQFVNLQKQNYKNWFRLNKVRWRLRCHDHSKEHLHAVPPRLYDPFRSTFWHLFFRFSVSTDSFVDFLQRVYLWRLVRKKRDSARQTVSVSYTFEAATPENSKWPGSNFVNFTKTIL